MACAVTCQGKSRAAIDLSRRPRLRSTRVSLQLKLSRLFPSPPDAVRKPAEAIGFKHEARTTQKPYREVNCVPVGVGGPRWAHPIPFMFLKHPNYC